VRPGRGGNGNGCALRLGANPDARVCRDGRWSGNRREYPERVIRADDSWRCSRLIGWVGQLDSTDGAARNATNEQLRGEAMRRPLIARFDRSHAHGLTSFAPVGRGRAPGPASGLVPIGGALPVRLRSICGHGDDRTIDQGRLDERHAATEAVVWWSLAVLSVFFAFPPTAGSATGNGCPTWGNPEATQAYSGRSRTGRSSGETC